MTFKHFSIFQLPFLLWVLCIFGLSSIASVPVVKSPVSLDKIGHIVMFFILTWLGWRAFRYQERIQWLRRYALLSAALFAGFYGGLNELHQMSLPGRSADFYDAIANAAGAGLYVVWSGYRSRRESHHEREI